MLVSCGTEKTKKIVENENYNYVEIEECTIPIPKKYEMTNYGNKEPYSHNYLYEEKRDKLNKQYIIMTTKRFEDDYISMKEFIAQGRNRVVVLETTRNNFKILESKIYDDTIYNLYGKKSVIGLMPSNETELNYLLNYCEKTWKLNKGDK
jgi:hypothetical protein